MSTTATSEPPRANGPGSAAPVEARLTPGRSPGVTGRWVSSDGPRISSSSDAAPNPGAASRRYVAQEPVRSPVSGTASSRGGAATGDEMRGTETRGLETLAAGAGASDSIGTTGAAAGAGAAGAPPLRARTAAVTAASSAASTDSSPAPDRDRISPARRSSMANNAD